MICLKRKFLASFILALCFTYTTSFAAFETDVGTVAVSKNSETEYSLSVSGVESSGGAMLVVYGDKQGRLGETLSMNPSGTFKNYYIYYTRYIPKDSGYMTLKCKFDVSPDVLNGYIYASVVSYDGKITHLSDAKLPGLKSAEKVKVILPDGSDPSAVFKVNAGNAYKFNAEVVDCYGNTIETSGLKYSLEGNTSKNIVLDGNALIIDKANDVYGSKIKLTASIGEISSSVDVEVQKENNGNSGNSGNSGGSSRSGSKGSSLSPISVTQDILNSEKDKDKAIFKDLSPEHWAYDNIVRLQSMGILNGNDGNVYPSSPITREEISALLTRSLNLSKDNTNIEQISSDKTVSSWAVSDVAAAVSAGIIKGDENGVINGLSSATREEAFTILARAFEVSESDGQTSFEDIGSVSEWARGYITSMSEMGILNGTDGKINPESNITRAEFFAVLDRMIK